MVTLTLANSSAVSYACLNYHYAKRIPVVAIAFNVYEDNDWCGVICYGWGANPHIADIYDKWNGQVLELVRVALNGKQKTTSECLAASLKELKKYAPALDLVVSYADVDQEHKGIIYQATNWTYVGLMNEGVKATFVIHGKKMHPRSVGAKNWKVSLEWIKQNVDKNATQEVTKGKHKYLYPLNKKMRKQIEPLAIDYPNGSMRT
jgi:hypothetical protein